MSVVLKENKYGYFPLWYPYIGDPFDDNDRCQTCKETTTDPEELCDKCYLYNLGQFHCENEECEKPICMSNIDNIKQCVTLLCFDCYKARKEKHEHMQRQSSLLKVKMKRLLTTKANKDAKGGRKRRRVD